MNNKWVIPAGCVALAVIIVFSALPWLTQCTRSSATKSLSYLTDVGEQRTVSLADGTTVNLNSNTWLYVAFDNDTRKITLSRGEAYFLVADEERPFKVVAGEGVVTAQNGTFIAQTDGGETVISVVGGRVEVHLRHSASQRLELTELQKMTVTGQQLGQIEKVSHLEPDWRDGWLEFENEALGDVVEELDKYYRGHIRLQGEGVLEMRVSGRFDIAQIRKAVRILAKSMQLEMAFSETGDVTFFPPEERADDKAPK